MLGHQQAHQGCRVGLGPLKVTALVDTDLDADACGVSGAVGTTSGVIGRFTVRQTPSTATTM